MNDIMEFAYREFFRKWLSEHYRLDGGQAQPKPQAYVAESLWGFRHSSAHRPQFQIVQREPYRRNIFLIRVRKSLTRI